MATVAKDQDFAGGQVRWLRKTLRLTLENLADAAGVPILAAEKAESGRHRPDERTLRAIAGAAGIDPAFFAEPSGPQETTLHADIRNTLRQSMMIPLKPLTAAADILAMFEERRSYRLETPLAASAGLDDQAEALLHEIRRMDEAWEGWPVPERLAQAARLAEVCTAFHQKDHSCWFGAYARRRRIKERSISEKTGLISVRKGQRPAKAQFALIRTDDSA